MIDLKEMTIIKAQAAFKNGDFTPTDLLEAYLKVIEEKNSDINAYLEVFDDARDQAKKAEEMIRAGNMQPLTGVPIGLKDNILYKDHRVTAASKILEGYVAPYDSTLLKDLREQGAVIIGRTNMDEFAMGSSTETSAYGGTKNPIDTTKVPGGSSGGSAAALAMDGALMTFGSDTAGSVRQPAAFCGVVGLKPTYGTISRHGLMAMASSLDIIGPFTKTVTDAEVTFKSIAHHDAMDSTSHADNKRVCVKKQVKTIGVPRKFLQGDGIDKETLANFEESLEKLKGLGYEIKDVEVQDIEHSLAAYYILMPAEASTNLARFDGVRFGLSVPGADVNDSYKKTKAEGFGKEVQRRVLLGAYVLSHGYYDAYYNKAVKLRAKITQELNRVFEDVDLIATPTTPQPAFAPGEKSDPVSMYLSDIFTVPANITGVPAISIPAGKNEAGLPLDIQFMAPHFGENLLFEVGKKFNQE